MFDVRPFVTLGRGAPEDGMHELIRLLREFGADEALNDLAERFVAENGAQELDDEELETLLSGLVAFADDDEASAALLQEAAGVATAIRAEVARRDEEAAEEEAERAAAAAQLRGEDDDKDETEEPAETAEDDSGDDGEQDDEPADQEEAEEPEPVAVAASANRAARRALARRRPRDAEPRETEPGVRITFAADVPNVPAGASADSLQDVNRALYRRWQSFARSTARGTERIPVATIHRDIPEERRLVDPRGRALSAHEASERVQSVIREAVARYRAQGPAALTAAGGLCAPATPIYAVDVLGEQGRPIRDSALVSFAAPRGSVVSVTPPTLAQVAVQNPNSVGAWTVSDDEDAIEGSPTKTIARIECNDAVETAIEAITRRVIIGNMLARTFGEFVDAWSELVMVHHDRFAEARLFAAIQSAAITTNVALDTTTLSATRDVLNLLAQVAWNMRSRHRLGRDFPFRAILPDILFGVMQTDIARSMPGGSFAENLNVAEATLQSFFTARNINVTWSPDLVVQPAPAGGAQFPGWPTKVPYAVYPEGTFLHLDAGELDLGVVRDSTLNATNDFELFAETFEAVHPLGVEAVAGEVEVCPTGAVSGTEDLTTICGTGS